MLIWLEKVEHYKLKICKIFENIYENVKNYKILWYQNPKTKNYQQ